MYILKCIVCFKELKPIDKDASDFPYGGTQFHTFGHYGSTFFDPMDGSALEINVCDKCLEASQACNLVKEVGPEVYNKSKTF